jgi:hypothetical protein
MNILKWSEFVINESKKIDDLKPTVLDVLKRVKTNPKNPIYLDILGLDKIEGLSQAQLAKVITHLNKSDGSTKKVSAADVNLALNELEKNGKVEWKKDGSTVKWNFKK